MAAGFVHGVLNTDNMNLTGESFDYGPYRFLPHNDPNFTAAYFDHAGLYSFGRQPEAVFWNLQQLAGALSLVAETDALVEALNGFGAAYRGELTAAMLAPAGRRSRAATEADAALVQAAFRRLRRGRRAAALGAVLLRLVLRRRRRRALAGPRGDLYAADGFAEFRRLLAGFEPDRPERLAASLLRAGRAGGAAVRPDRGALGADRRAPTTGRPSTPSWPASRPRGWRGACPPQGA